MKRDTTEVLTLWEHLDILRGVLWRILAVVVVLAVAAFCFRESLFSIVLAPDNSDFITYRWLGFISERLFGSDIKPFNVELINTQLAGQFMIHIRVSIYVACLLALPYILYAMFGFVSPGLYENERHFASAFVFWGYILFWLGVLLNYFVVFPLTFRFLGTYAVSSEVSNLISLTSYIDTLSILSIAMGLVFEIPLLCWLAAKAGILNSDIMVKYRRYAILVVVIVAAIITPTSDAVTLFVVSAPMILLYEAGIVIVRRTSPKRMQPED